jgi:hypothetical protein
MTESKIYVISRTVTVVMKVQDLALAFTPSFYGS